MEVKVEVTGEQTRYFFTDDAYHKSQKTVLITRFTFHVSRENILQFHLSSRQWKEGE